MLWRAISHWILAGCLSATALNFSAETKKQEDIFPAQQPVVESMVPSAPEIPAPLPINAAETPAVSLSPSAPMSVVVPVTPVPVPSAKNSNPVSDAPASNNPSAPQVLGVEEYKVQGEDVLQITVYEEPDLTTKVRVAGSGEINFPLLGRIAVAGLSVIEVQEKVTKLLAEDYLVNPQVQVFIDIYHARNVFVTGAVNKPGSYPIPTGRPTTVMEAITMAAGFAKAAAINSTRIIRIENGKETTINVKANDIIRKGDKTKDVEVRPNDVVFVPESFF